jgi:hypothetical protein
MNRLLILLLLHTVVSINAQGQDSGFLTGYIISNSNDTIHGLVKYINQVPYRVLIDIKFKENEKSKTKVYPPGTIIGYRAEGKTFHSLKLPGGNQFMELVIDGHVRLYRSTVTSFGVPQYGPANQSDDFLLKSGDKNLFSVRKGKFKERLSEYLADNNTISTKIKNGEYKKNDIELIINEYNISRVMDVK